MVLLQQENFLCENKNVDVLMYKINGKFFFNATIVHKSFGAPSSLEFSEYLRTESARRLMLQMYGNLNGFDKLSLEINTLTKGGKIPPFTKTTSKAHNSSNSNKMSDDLERNNEIAIFLQATLQIRLNKLNPEFEKDFVYVVKGRNGATFLCYDLFLDYCTHLSTQLKLQVFETFKKFGDLNNLEGKALADALQKKAIDVLAKLPPYTPQVVSTIVREEVKEKTKNLHQSIQNVYHTYAPPTRDYNMYMYIHDQINKKLFGATSISMHKVIELQKNSSVKLRDCMTDKAIRLLEQVESSIHVFLSDCHDDNVIPPLDELNSVIEESCASALSIARRRKDDFLLLQLAIERDYDLLIKNADCVKNIGVIARPNEFCDKGSLLELNTSIKLLAITKQKASKKTTQKTSKLLETKQISLDSQNDIKQESFQMSFLKDII